MDDSESTVLFRVQYHETDRMGTFCNSRALEWFEHGRTELMRTLGIPYTTVEQRGVFLPVVEAHLHFLGRAQYDDILKIETRAGMAGKASVRFDVTIVHAADGAEVVKGHTIHAVTDASGKPVRPPEWFVVPFEEQGKA